MGFVCAPKEGSSMLANDDDAFSKSNEIEIAFFFRAKLIFLLQMEGRKNKRIPGVRFWCQNQKMIFKMCVRVR